MTSQEEFNHYIFSLKKNHPNVISELALWMSHKKTKSSLAYVHKKIRGEVKVRPVNISLALLLTKLSNAGMSIRFFDYEISPVDSLHDYYIDFDFSQSIMAYWLFHNSTHSSRNAISKKCTGVVATKPIERSVIDLVVILSNLNLIEKNNPEETIKKPSQGGL
jgi:hypothetical protein